MNREIKFRAWEHEAKEFIYLDPNKEEFDSKWLKDDEQSACQQYTGLKDKNGKEIWEGDVLLSTKENFREVGVIRYEKGRFIARTNDDGWLPLEESCVFCHHRDGTVKEIIGNIYENPNLSKP